MEKLEEKDHRDEGSASLRIHCAHSPFGEVAGFIAEIIFFKYTLEVTK